MKLRLKSTNHILMKHDHSLLMRLVPSIDMYVLISLKMKQKQDEIVSLSETLSKVQQQLASSEDEHCKLKDELHNTVEKVVQHHCICMFDVFSLSARLWKSKFYQINMILACPRLRRIEYYLKILKRDVRNCLHWYFFNVLMMDSPECS